MPYVSEFVRALPEARREEAKAIGDLEHLLESLVETGRALSPGVRLEPEIFLRHLAELVKGSENLESVIHATRGGDLWLACAAANGDVRAIAILDEQIAARVPAALGRMRLPMGTAEDVLQLVRLKVLVGDGTRASKIREYAGRGPLQGWLRVVAVRTALDALRAQGGATGDDEVMADVIAGTDDPEARLLRDRHVAEFKAAFGDAVQGMPPKERAMLRLHFVDGLSIDEVGNVYRVHRATAARWIAAARVSLLREVRVRLAQRLRASESELDSVMRGVRSQLDVSLCNYLTSND